MGLRRYEGVELVGCCPAPLHYTLRDNPLWAHERTQTGLDEVMFELVVLV